MLKIGRWKVRLDLSLTPKEPPLPKRVNAFVESRSTRIVNSVGYIILFLTLLDYTILFVTAPKFFQAVWGWETIGKLVETVWGLLLGFVLIFYRRERDLIKPRELNFLALLSQLALVLGILYFLTVPVLLGNAFRIDRGLQAKVSSQVARHNEQVEEYSQRLDRYSDRQLDSLLQMYRQQAPKLEMTSSKKLKETLLTQARLQKKQIEAKFSKQRFELFKTTFKWAVGAIVSGISLIGIWHFTHWARYLSVAKD